jgi:hypothetical protein
MEQRGTRLTVLSRAPRGPGFRRRVAHLYLGLDRVIAVQLAGCRRPAWSSGPLCGSHEGTVPFEGSASYAQAAAKSILRAHSGWSISGLRLPWSPAAM